MRELQKIYGGLGQFALDKSFLYDSDPAVLQAVLFGMIIISAEHHWEGNRIVYRGFHPDFKEIELGAMVTDYTPTVFKEYADDNDLAGDYGYRVTWTEIKKT